MLEIIFIAISLSADAFAVTISNALAYAGDKKLWYAPIYFGVFQGIMPIIGYFCADFLPKMNASNIIVCVLLSIIGSKMIFEGIFAKETDAPTELTHKTLFFEAIATSIDALAVGISLSLMSVEIFFASTIFAIVTFGLCKTAIKICKKIEHTSSFEVLGGAILILIGLKELLF